MNTLAQILTYSGTLPLVGAVILTFFPIAGLDAQTIAKTYSAIIISFLCGIHWSVYLFFEDKCPRNLLITSNSVALLAWGSLLLNNSAITLILQIICFVYLLTLDKKLFDVSILPNWFFHLRRNATIIVVLCLSIIFCLSILI